MITIEWTIADDFYGDDDSKLVGEIFEDYSDN